jgi:predicted transcriptional regulator of viral defense system
VTKRGQIKKKNSMQTTIMQIERKIKSFKRGKIFFLDNFADLGTPETVKKSLQRLTNSGLLVRLANGIYWYPKKEKELYGIKIAGKPTLDEIAKAIAKRDKARIVPTGLHALNLLNLSTQVPANVVYLTDVTPRKITIGNGKGILFKHTSEVKRLAYKSEHLMLIVSAIREIGENNVTAEQLAIIKKHFSYITKQEFETDIELVPVWIRKILLTL